MKNLCRRLTFAGIAVLSFGALFAEEPVPALIWPIDRPMMMTGTFAEFRGARYHHGIDMSTDNCKGFRIFAAAEGSIETVMYKNFGIGYGIVMKHRGGYKTLYGHMDAFSSRILDSKAVLPFADAIRAHKDFRIDLTHDPIFLKQGDLIGFSGDTGIGVEHFHFELMDKDENLINPLRAGLSVPDSTAPEINSITLVPLDEYSHINGKCAPLTIRAVKKKGAFVLASTALKSAGGRIGLKTDAFDRIGAQNSVGIYRADITLSGKTATVFAFDTFKRDDSRMCGFFYDYASSTYSVYNYFLYNRASGEGMVNTAEYKKGSRIAVTITLFDAALNTAVLNCEIPVSPPLSKAAFTRDINLRTGKALSIHDPAGKAALDIPAKAVLYDESVSIKPVSPVKSRQAGLIAVSSVYSVLPRDLALITRAQLHIAGKKDRQTGIYIVGRDGYCSYTSSWYDDARRVYSAEIYRMQQYCLMKDVKAPAVYCPDTAVSGMPFLITLRDGGSGVDISRISVLVDGKKVEWFFDADYDAAVILPHNDIFADGAHSVSVSASDTAGNSTGVLAFKYTVAPGRGTIIKSN